MNSNITNSSNQNGVSSQMLNAANSLSGVQEQNGVQSAKSQASMYSSSNSSFNNSLGNQSGSMSQGMQNGVSSQMLNASSSLNGVQHPSGEQAAKSAAMQFMQNGNAGLNSSSLQNTVQAGRQSVQNPQGMQ